MTLVYLLRHGETVWNAEGNKYCGLTDIELSDTGLKQTEAAREILSVVSFDKVYASPLQRAVKTAEVISGNVKNIVTDERLSEINFGGWEGLTRSEIEHTDKLRWDEWLVDPDTVHAGESGEKGFDVVKRGLHFFEDLKKHHEDHVILVVAHNTFNRLLATEWLGLPRSSYRSIKMHNAGISILEINEKTEVIQWNSMMHLSQL
ncbi:histidine phosphatase family protein [Jeotgalibacillus malaysiensis]|uniref:histidine phosphatase family protein n=1 Tax=Jeotgalibacillus malaysiensis TaxID=1508404 RepID=UPI003851567D